MKKRVLTEARAFELLGFSDPDWYEQSAQAVREFASAEDNVACKAGKTTRMLVRAAMALLDGKRVKIDGFSGYRGSMGFGETPNELREKCLQIAKRLTKDSFTLKKLNLILTHEESMCMPFNRSKGDIEVLKFRDHALDDFFAGTHNMSGRLYEKTSRYGSPNLQNIPYPKSEAKSEISKICEDIYNTKYRWNTRK